jgi:hypothetical protein
VGKAHTVQEFASPWWIRCDPHTIQRGQLIRAFVPHVDLTPLTLTPEGREAPTSHDTALFRIAPLRIRDPQQRRSRLPVAALPIPQGEIHTVHRSKVRPVLVVSTGGSDVPKVLRPSTSPKWQTAPTFLVAPFYGTERTDERAGWHPQFIDRIRQCEYPQFMLDTLPGSTTESVLRFDHIQPVGRHHESYEPMEFCLSADALCLVDEWLTWLRFGELDAGALLADIRGELMAAEGPANTPPGT